MSIFSLKWNYNNANMCSYKLHYISFIRENQYIFIFSQIYDKIIDKRTENIMNLDNLSYLLHNRGEKHKLSKETGISTGNIRDWFNPDRKSQPSAEALIKIADYFGCSVDYILGRTNSFTLDQSIPQYPDNIIHLFDTGDIIEIGTYQQPVSAGNGNVIDNSQMIPQIYPQTQISSQADFYVRVSGDSMYPLYESGDILFVKNIDKSEIRNNDIGIFFYINDSYCKRYNEEDGNITLISENSSSFEPIKVYPNNEFRVQGKVLGKYHVD